MVGPRGQAENGNLRLAIRARPSGRLRGGYSWASPLLESLAAGSDGFARFIWSLLSPDVQARLKQIRKLSKSADPEDLSHEIRTVLADGLTAIVHQECAWDRRRYSKLSLLPETRELIDGSNRPSNNTLTRAPTCACQKGRYCRGLPGGLGFREPSLFEVRFKGGMPLPEEFIELSKASDPARQLPRHPPRRAGRCEPDRRELSVPAAKHHYRRDIPVRLCAYHAE